MATVYNLAGVEMSSLIRSIPLHLLEQCYQHGIDCYPEEACGCISGLVSDPFQLDSVHLLKNQMSFCHQLDPEQYPETNRNAYLMDPQIFRQLVKSLEVKKSKIKVLYHTHPDVGAYFSATDEQQALWNGLPRHPDMVYLVCGIKNTKKDGAILVYFDEFLQKFDSVVLDGT